MPKRTMADAFPSKYLTALDVEGKDIEAVIESVDYEKMRDGAEKPVATFEGLSKSIVLNKTKAKVLFDITGSMDFDDWVGTKVTALSRHRQLQRRDRGHDQLQPYQGGEEGAGREDAGRRNPILRLADNTAKGRPALCASSGPICFAIQ